jgi:hypothetical protein
MIERVKAVTGYMPNPYGGSNMATGMESRSSPTGSIAMNITVSHGGTELKRERGRQQVSFLICTAKDKVCYQRLQLYAFICTLSYPEIDLTDAVNEINF